MVMVAKANEGGKGLGGHIASYSSSSAMYEVGFNWFFKGPQSEHGADLIYFQGHSSPGMYARAFIEGRLTEDQLEHFRQETEGKGLSSYPHPYLMPEFWQFPTVSMGLGPSMAIYQARFMKYMEGRGLKNNGDRKVWVFMGDGESDEPESLAALSLASREKLDNLIFVVNCNLQRLDGPVRGNGKIIQELEGKFRGAGWNVIKVIWGSDWDPLLDKDRDGALVERMNEVVDGQLQKYTVESGAYTREHFFNTPELRKLAEHLTDEQIRKMRRGGHDPEKVYAAYDAAVKHKGAPTCILAMTVKGYGLGESGEGRNVTHQQKKLNDEELKEFRARFGIPISDEDIAQMPFYRPPDHSPEMQYVRERRNALGGHNPCGKTPAAPPIEAPHLDAFAEFLKDSGGREVSTTMAFVRMFGRLLRDPQLGKLIVPIVPDEARTFGMEALFRQAGIYSSRGQLYEPVDKETVLYYREATDGQILEEGITEAGSMASFIAAGTAYATHAVNTIPFFLYYSMFGFQRVGDLIWCAADSRARGFLLGCTAGRTTLNGEGLQHQDGHSHLLAATVPNCLAYDPAYAYETAVIVQDGIRRMYEAQEPVFYYLTLHNENYEMPAMPEGAREGIVRGMYRLRSRQAESPLGRVQLLGSGAILREVLRAQDILAERYGVSSDAWSVTSYKELRREAMAAERWNRLHPGDAPRQSYLERIVRGAEGPFVAASDYMRLVAEQIAPWLPDRLVALGTDGFGRSDTRRALRRFFEVDAECVALAALRELAARGILDAATPAKAIAQLGIDPGKPDPAAS